MNLKPEDIPYNELWAYPGEITEKTIEILNGFYREYGITSEILSPERSEYGRGTWKVILREPQS